MLKAGHAIEKNSTANRPVIAGKYNPGSTSYGVCKMIRYEFKAAIKKE
jgi:hypothetical protein